MWILWVAGWKFKKSSTRHVGTYVVEAAGGRPGETGTGGRVAGRGPAHADNLTSWRQEMPEKASQAEHNERRRATGGALAIDMASLRSVGRCERFGALQRRMPPARVPRIHPPRSPHLLCIYRAPQPALPGDAGLSATTSISTYVSCLHSQAATMRVTPACYDNEYKNSNRSLNSAI